MQWLQRFRNPARDRDERRKMFIPSFITMFCVGGVSFYLRVLIALCKEWKPRSRRDRIGSQFLPKTAKAERFPSNPQPSIATLKISEIRLNNIDSHEFRR